MKALKWMLLTGIAVALVSLFASVVFMPLGWGMGPMMGGFYGLWGRSWLAVLVAISFRTLFWLLPIMLVVSLINAVLGDERCAVEEPVSES